MATSIRGASAVPVEYTVYPNAGAIPAERGIDTQRGCYICWDPINDGSPVVVHGEAGAGDCIHHECRLNDLLSGPALAAQNEGRVGMIQPCNFCQKPVHLKGLLVSTFQQTRQKVIDVCARLRVPLRWQRDGVESDLVHLRRDQKVMVSNVTWMGGALIFTCVSALLIYNSSEYSDAMNDELRSVADKSTLKSYKDIQEIFAMAAGLSILGVLSLIVESVQVYRGSLAIRAARQLYDSLNTDLLTLSEAAEAPA